MKPQSKTFVSVETVSVKTGLPMAWLKAEAEAGRIPSLKAGRQRLFNLNAVEQALLQRGSSFEQGDQQ